MVEKVCKYRILVAILWKITQTRLQWSGHKITTSARVETACITDELSSNINNNNKPAIRICSYFFLRVGDAFINFYLKYYQIGIPSLEQRWLRFYRKILRSLTFRQCSAVNKKTIQLQTGKYRHYNLVGFRGGGGGYNSVKKLSFFLFKRPLYFISILLHPSFTVLWHS